MNPYAELEAFLRQCHAVPAEQVIGQFSALADFVDEVLDDQTLAGHLRWILARGPIWVEPRTEAWEAYDGEAWYHAGYEDETICTCGHEITWHTGTSPFFHGPFDWVFKDEAGEPLPTNYGEVRLRQWGTCSVCDKLWFWSGHTPEQAHVEMLNRLRVELLANFRGVGPYSYDRAWPEIDVAYPHFMGGTTLRVSYEGFIEWDLIAGSETLAAASAQDPLATRAEDPPA